MNDLNKIIVILVRLQGIGFMLSGLVYWFVLAVQFVMVSLNPVPSRLANYESLLATSIATIAVGIILYARSWSLAKYFIGALGDDEKTP